MRVKIKLLSDAIFGSGQSIPGGEDIAVLHDIYGFPYISGSSVKGVLREEIKNYFVWTKTTKPDEQTVKLFGRAGDKEDVNQMNDEQTDKLMVSDFTLPFFIRKAVIEELDLRNEDTRQQNQGRVLDIFTNIRTFTKIEDGRSKNGSLRNARCVKSGFIFEGEILCAKENQKMVKECLSYVKWLGTMRTRGFGHVLIQDVVKGA